MKETSIKALCVLLAAILMFSSFNMYVAAEEPYNPWLDGYDLPVLDGSILVLEEASEAAFAAADIYISQAIDIARGTFDGHEFDMYYVPERGLYFVPDFGLYFDPERPMFFSAMLDMWLENHTIASPEDTFLMETSEWLEEGIMAAFSSEPEIIWACAEEEAHYLTHGRLRNLTDYIVPFEAFAMSVSEPITSEQFEAFFASGMWEETYNAVRALNLDLAAYEAMLARSGLTLAELVAALVLTGDTIVSIQEFLARELTLDLQNHSVTFAWNGEMIYEEALAELAITPFSVNAPTISGWLVAWTHNSATVNGRIDNVGGGTITMRGSWHRRAVDVAPITTNAQSATGNNFTVTISGLVPSTRYIVRAIARNSAFPANTGQSHEMSFTTTSPPPPPVQPPGAPQNLRTSAGRGQVTLMWNAPSNNGGGAITRYEVSIDNGAWMQVQSSSSHTFTNLMDMNHSFRVRAVNSAGAGVTANTSARPNANEPSLTSSMAGLTHNSATISGNITNVGGGAINMRGSWHRRTVDSQEITTNANSVSGNWFSVTIPNLIPNTAYVARAVARNTHFPHHMGQGNILSFTTLNPPATVPSVPRNFAGTSPSAGRANLTWQVPASDGGSWIMRHEISANNGPWVFAQSSTWHNFENLPGGVNTFRIRAINAVGASPIATTSVTVQAPPPTVTFNYTSVGHTSGSPPASHSINIPGTITLRQPGMLRTGFTFGGWSDGNEVFAAGQSFNFTTGATRTINFTAVWNPIVLTQVNVTLDPNGGEFGTPRRMAEELDAEAFEATDFETADLNIEIMPLSRLPFIHMVAVGSLATQLPEPERDGYSFVGWTTTRNGSNFATRIEAVHHNTTLFAAWQPAPVITNPRANGDALFVQTPTVTWQAVTGAIYHITLTNVSTNAILINRQQVNGTSFTISTSLLTEGHTYEFEVFATVGTRVSHSSRSFVVSSQAQGIAVHVVDSAGRALQGAHVQFVHGTVNWTFAYTDANGMAFLPRAATGRWGVNVTHPNFASAAHTVTPYTRSGSSRVPNFTRDRVDQVQSISFTMRYPIADFRRLGWGNVLPDMDVRDNHRVQSVYGYRRRSGVTFHLGIDLVGRWQRNIPTLGREVLSAFEGRVEQVWENVDYAGYAIVVQFFDEDNDVYFYARYTHLRFHPATEDDEGRRTDLHGGETLLKGHVLGRMGSTGASDGPHLHLEVFRSHSDRWHYATMRNVTHSIDPRAFFAPDFARPWHYPNGANDGL